MFLELTIGNSKNTKVLVNVGEIEYILDNPPNTGGTVVRTKSTDISVKESYKDIYQRISWMIPCLGFMEDKHGYSDIEHEIVQSS